MQFTTETGGETEKKDEGKSGINFCHVCGPHKFHLKWSQS